MPGLLDRLRRRPPPEVAAAVRDRVARLLGAPHDPALHASSEPSGEAADVAPTASDEPSAALGPVVLDPARRGAAALTAVAVLAALATGGLVWRSRPRPVAVVAPTVVSASAGAERGQVVIDVQGAVRRPGLVTLPAGARVADALAAAGGLRPGASTRGLNLARRLTDGEQVVVLEPGAAPAAGATGLSGAAAGGTSGGAGSVAAGSGVLLDLNLATLAQLDGLPGVGPVTAQRILAWRAEHGRFASVDQLREVDGIGDKRFEALRELVVV